MAEYRDHRDRDSINGKLERAKDASLGRHDRHPSVADEIGEAAGGIGGVLLGAGIGSTMGPVGAIIGGIAGALGGWWTGRAIAEAADKLSHEDEVHYRRHFESQPFRLADRSYEDVRGAYYLGHIASQNPNFTGREFVEIEPELEEGWAATGDRFGSWAAMRLFAAEGYQRGRAKSKLDEKARRALQEQEGRTPGERGEGRK